MQATRRRTQVVRDLQLSSIAFGRRGGRCRDGGEAGGVANPSPPPTAGREGRGVGGRNRDGIPPWAWVSGRDWSGNLGGGIQLMGEEPRTRRTRW
jgi:hypothetical protein